MSEPPKVVSLKGDPITLPGVPSASVIECLEKVLDAAKSGEICGVIIVSSHSDDCVSGAFRGDNGRQSIGMMEEIKADIIDAMRRAGA